jgi:hypothetical protein
MKQIPFLLIALTGGPAIWLGGAGSTYAQTDIVVSFVTTNPTPLNPGFSGFNTTADNAVEYYDTNFQQIVTTLSPGWLRYPAGTESDAFDWRTGQMRQAWVDGLAADPGQQSVCAGTLTNIAGKGGASFSDFSAMAAKVGGAKIVVDINAFTDTTDSAGAFAQYALTNHIPVAVWELCNEAYLFTGATNFFMNGADYAAKMKPFRDAIKTVDSNAVVALFFSDAGHTNAAWDNALAGYTNQYWDAVTYHHYISPGSLTNFDDLMALANGVLVSNTTSHVTNYLMPLNQTNVVYLITEYDPASAKGGPLDGTLYGGIYAAEYALRMSTIPQMRFVGTHQILNAAGIDETNSNLNVVNNAYTNGIPTNTSGLNFGFFLSAQAAGEAVANGALYRSTGVYATTTTGGPTVPTYGGGNVPAVYAQAYQGGNGKHYVVVINKGASNLLASIKQDGVTLGNANTNKFLETFVTGSDPSLTNSAPPPNNVRIQTQTGGNPVTILPYSVMRLEWQAFDVPPPQLGLTVSNTTENLSWAGLPNVVYNVQGASNLLGSWTTLGRVANTATNFSYTDWNSGSQQFYRLAVP